MTLTLGTLLLPDAGALTFTHTLGGGGMPPAVAASPAAPLETGAAEAATPWAELLSGLEQAPSWRQAQAEAQASEARSRQGAIRAWAPRLDATARREEQRQRYNGVQLSSPGSSSELTATLPLWRPADRADARSQNATAEQSRWQARLRRQTLAVQASQAYLEAAEAAEQWRLTLAHITALEGHALAQQRRLSAGVGTVVDLLETDTRLEQARARADQLRSRAASSTLRLQELSGRPVQTPSGLRPLHPGTLDEEPAALLDASPTPPADHPQRRAAQAEVEASQEALRARSAESWQPTLDATASRVHTRQTQRFDGLTERQDVRANNVGLVLNWPLFTSGLQQARHSEGAAMLAGALARLDEVESRLTTGLVDALQRRAQARRQVVRSQAVLTSASTTLAAVLKAWQAGLRGTPDLLDAQARVHEANMGLASARIDAMRSGAEALALLDELDGPHIAAWQGAFEASALPPFSLEP